MKCEPLLLAPLKFFGAVDTKPLYLFAVFFFLISASDRNVLANDSVRTVAFTGQRAPTPAGVQDRVFRNFFSGPTLNINGEIGFRAEIALDEANNSGREAIYRGTQTGVDLVALEGLPAPGLDDLNFGRFIRPIFRPLINDNGTIVFGSVIGDAAGVFVNRPGEQSTLLGRTGDPVPEIGDGVTFSTNIDFGLSVSTLTSTGQILGGGALVGEGIDSRNRTIGFRSDTKGNIELISRIGEPAPGFGPDINFDAILSRSTNDNGQSVLYTRLRFGPTFDDVSHAIYVLDSDGSLLPGRDGRALVAESGDSLPPFGPGVELANSSLIGPLLINDVSQIVLAGVLSGDGVVPSNNLGILRLLPNGEFVAVAREDDVIPGAGGARIGDSTVLRSTLLLNNRGDVVFATDLRGNGVDPSNDSAILANRGGASLEVLAREGQPAPSLGEGVFFDQLGDVTRLNFEGAALAADGRVALEVFLTGDSVDATNNLALYAEDTNGVLQLIAREGDLLDVNDDPGIDDLRTISFLDFDPRGFSDRNEVAFLARFTDGSSGIFISSLVAIPEPSSFCLMSCLAALLACRKPRYSTISLKH